MCDARNIREVSAAGSGHSAGCLGFADVMAVLYFHAMRLDPENPNWEDRDILGLRRDHSDCIIQIFFVRDGKIIGRDHSFLKIDDEDSDEEILSLFLRQFYNGTPFIPKEIQLWCSETNRRIL